MTPQALVEVRPGADEVATPIIEQARRDAARLLRAVWTGGAPRPELPVDPIKIARSLGIDVFEVPLGEAVAAALVKRPGYDPQILLSNTDSPNRRRVACAHELGHFVRRPKDPDRYEYVDHRDFLSSGEDDPDEAYATEFAAWLLMPEPELRHLCRAGATEAELAWYFDVTREALYHRLDEARLTA